MKIFHFIPTAEESLHQLQDDCECEPIIVNQERLNDTSWAGELVYEHHPLLTAEMQEEDEGLVRYTAIEQI